MVLLAFENLMTLESPSVLGVGQSEFNEEVWAGIAGAYFESAHRLSPQDASDSNRWYNTSAKQVLDGYGAYRFGSVITMHSKLLVCRYNPDAMHFDFYANADPYELAWAQSDTGVTEESIREDFRNKVGLFLSGLGIAKEITHCIDVR